MTQPPFTPHADYTFAGDPTKTARGVVKTSVILAAGAQGMPADRAGFFPSESAVGLPVTCSNVDVYLTCPISWLGDGSTTFTFLRAIGVSRGGPSVVWSSWRLDATAYELSDDGLSITVGLSSRGHPSTSWRVELQSSIVPTTPLGAGEVAIVGWGDESTPEQAGELAGGDAGITAAAYPVRADLDHGYNVTTGRWKPLQVDDEGRLIVTTTSGANVAPSGDTTGATDGPRIQAILDQGLTAVLESGGTYYAATPILMRSATGIVASVPGQPAALLAGSAWTAGSVTALSNYQIVGSEVESGTSTTVATTTTMGSPTLPITSATGFAAGTWFKSIGIQPAGTDYYGQSAGPNAPVEELLRVGSIAGTVVTNGLSMLCHQGAGKILKTLTTVVDGFNVADLELDGHGQIVAGGVSCTFGRAITVEDCISRNHLAYAVELRGCKDSRIARLTHRGGSNGYVMFTSCQGSEAVGIYDHPDTVQVLNSLGGAKAWFRVGHRSQSAQIEIQDAHVRNAAGAFLTWGGVSCRVIDCDASDSNGELLYTDPREDVGFGVRGPSLDLGANDIATAAFSEACSWQTFDALRSNHGAYVGPGFGTNTPCGQIYLHDSQRMRLDAVRATTLGSDGEGTGTSPLRLCTNGIRVQDTDGQWGRLECEGALYGLLFSGASPAFSDCYYVYNPAAGTGNASSGIPISMLECSQGVPNFRRVDVLNASNFTICDTSFAPPPAAYSQPFIGLAIGVLVPPSTGLVARNVVLGKWPDSTTGVVAGLIYTPDLAQTTAAIVMAASAGAAVHTAGEPRGFVALDTYFVGGTRIAPVVRCGPTMCCPVAMIGGAGAIAIGQTLKSNNLGQAIANTVLLVADVQAICGIAQHTITADALAQAEGA